MPRKARRFDQARKAEAYARLCRRRLEGAVELDAPMSERTSFRIGGPADIIFSPACVQDVVSALRLCRLRRYPLTVMGLGTNLLVRDGGVRGVVLAVGKAMSGMRRDGSRVFAGAGAPLRELSKFAHACGLSGLEFACGIPGTVGGAVCMNAGAYGSEISAVVARAAYVARDGSVGAADAAECAFSHRHSRFLAAKGEVVVEAEFALAPGDQDRIAASMRSCLEKRAASQPLELPSAGSVFRRPDGMFVGPMIEACGLKGRRSGGARISEKHAGFIVNAGGGTALDVLELVGLCQREALGRFGACLEMEIRVIGEDPI